MLNNGSFDFRGDEIRRKKKLIRRKLVKMKDQEILLRDRGVSGNSFSLESNIRLRYEQKENQHPNRLEVDVLAVCYVTQGMLIKTSPCLLIYI